MGCCNSAQVSPADIQGAGQSQNTLVDAKSTRIDEEQARARAVEKHVCKILLLGAGESGKSTILKQLVKLYVEDFTTEQLVSQVGAMHTNVIEAMHALLDHCMRRGDRFDTDALEAADDVLHHELRERITPEVAAKMKLLWNHELVQHAYEERSQFQLSDSAAYFLSRVEVLASPGFVPSDEDYLRCRVRTTGIVEREFAITGSRFRIFDVGGQRNERKKWIHCFEDVTAVIFVVAISAYDQLLFEDETTNRMHEALRLFDQTINSRWFINTAMILFLNKRDIFYEKIATVPLRSCFPDFDGQDHVAEDCIDYIQFQFESRNRNHKKRQIYTHLTCATDTKLIAQVFRDIKDALVRMSLLAAGLL